MEIIHLAFEKNVRLNVSGKLVEVFVYPTFEKGNIKFGINASRKIPVNREEIYFQKKE